MDSVRSEGHTPDLAAKLLEAETCLDEAIDLVEDLIGRITVREEVSPSEAMRVARLMHAALHTFFVIRMRLDHDRTRKTAALRNDEIDLDAARDQIRSLLDCIRSDRDPDEVP